ncbi:hypothetical protein APR08_004136 [Nocardia amikacinitolerans]|nr:hypothetical protein [Nocardia amikacinitolerans]
MTLLQYDPLVMAAFAMVIAAILAIGLRAEDEPPKPSVRQIQDRIARQGYRIASDRNPGAHRVSPSVVSRHGLLRGRGAATMVYPAEVAAARQASSRARTAPRGGDERGSMEQAQCASKFGRDPKLRGATCGRGGGGCGGGWT